MLMLHYAPEYALRKIRRKGLAPSRYRARVDGVYAFPLVPSMPRTVATMWRRVLKKSKNKRGVVPAGVVFRVDSCEPVYWFSDWIENALGGNPESAMTAAEACVRTKEILKLQYLTFEEWMHRECPDVLRDMEEKKRQIVRFPNAPYLLERFLQKQKEALLDPLREEWLEARNSGWLGFLPEVIVPRRVMPEEIVRIHCPRRRIEGRRDRSLGPTR